MRKTFSATLALALFGATAALAQQWPAKPVRIISPFPPGGGIDGAARIIGTALSAQTGQQFVVENRAGATGRIGTELAARAAPDGYTLLLGSSATNAITPASGVKLPYDVVKDFLPVSQLAAADYLLVVHPSLPARNVKELVALAKRKPDQLTFASGGHLGAPHLAGELFNHVARVDTVHVPYRGTGPAALAVLTGETVMGFASGPSVSGHVKDGRLRALASTGERRSRPDLPTMAESLPGAVVNQWYGVLVPAGTPNAVVDRLHAEIVRAVKTPKVAEQFAALGNDPLGTSPAEFDRFIRGEIEKWSKVIRAARLDLG